MRGRCLKEGGALAVVAAAAHACIALAARCFFVATYSTLSCVRNQQDADLSRVISDLASAVPMKCGRSQNPASHFLPKEACSFYQRDLLRRFPLSFWTSVTQCKQLAKSSAGISKLNF
eukprot:Tamp_40009.p1 GENE.Tamp_40009~~Tamp_40009.p1  ORF type:complete len:118 (+),score=1.57 Tamp_40009:108-461(+)